MTIDWSHILLLFFRVISFECFLFTLWGLVLDAFSATDIISLHHSCLKDKNGPIAQFVQVWKKLETTSAHNVPWCTQ